VFTGRSGHERAETSFVPTRLIDLEPESSDPTPESVGNKLGIDPSIALAKPSCDTVLVEKGKSPSLMSAKDRIIYVALSYCWGSSGPPLKTETNTLEDRLRGIPICDMPQCFQDAIKIIRIIGVRYVWIDSLCIIQNDEKDWANEASLMFDVFSNSFLTLAVASTSSCHESFLYQSLPQRFQVPFQSRINPNISGSYFIQKSPPKEIPDHSYVEDQIPLNGDMFSSEWDKRGWVWQEQNAPSKLLIWGKSMLHFRDTIFTSEDGSGATSWHFGLDYSGLGGKNPQSKWYSWMRDFSSKKLSYRTDRLPAVSGLAKLVSRTTKDEYRAGHWYNKEDFWKELCWTVQYPPKFDELLQDLTASERYSAPSWSWASRSQQARWKIFPYNARLYESEIIDYQVTLKGEDSSGAVREGKVIIRGKLKQVQVPPSTGQYMADLSQKYYKKHYKWTWRLELPGTKWVMYTLDWMPDPTKAMDPNGPELQIYMLLLGLAGDREVSDPDNDYNYCIGGLLLYPFGGQFLRVGIFLICYSCGTKREFFDDIMPQVVTII
jgi:hypothetical protein